MAIYTINYNAATAGQILKIKLGKPSISLMFVHAGAAGTISY